MSYITRKVDALLLIISPHYDGTFLKYLAACYKAVSENNLGGKVFFKTGLTKNQLRPYYQLSDCFLMASNSLETYGLTMMEAISCGTPAIGGRKSGNIEEILQNIDPFLLTDKPTSKLFAQKILKYASLNKVKKNKLISKGIVFAKKYTWKYQAKLLEKYFYKIVTNYNKGKFR
jgi:glycosyltransferase involved in cell wall biosynthesis